MRFRQRKTLTFILSGFGLVLFLSAGCSLPLVWESPPPAETGQPSPTLVTTITTTDLQVSPTPVAPATLTATPAPESSPTLPAEGPTPAQTGLPYIIQPGAPAYGINFAHPELGCNWAGVAGQVLDIQRNPVEGMLVEVQGTIGGEDVQVLSLTGSAPPYGPGGFEIVLGSRPLPSDDSLGIQVFDISGERKSDLFTFDTYDDCQRNLVLINFVEAPDYPNHWYLPSSLGSVVYFVFLHPAYENRFYSA